MLSPADSLVASNDPALPGLSVLLDSGHFLSRLRTARPALDLRGAVPTYLRYKPGTSCMAGFRVDVAGVGVDVYARVFRVGDEAKLMKSARAREVPGPLGAGRILLPDCGVLVCAFPNDDGLANLRVLNEPQRRDALFRKVLGDRTGAASEIRTLAYKPERRYVGQVVTAGVPIGIVRFYTPAGYALATRNAKLFALTDAVRVPSRLGRSERWNVVGLEWLPGRSLYERLTGPAADVPPHAVMAELGRAVATIAKTGSHRFVPRTREAEIAAVSATAAGVAALWPPLAARVLELARHVANALAALPVVRRPMHGDLYAKQVVVDDGRVALIDVDGAVLGDPAADLANFAAHLERHAASGHVDPRCVGPAVDAVVAGYESAAGEELGPRLAAYAAAQLLRVAPHPFRGRERDWPQQMEALLDRASEALGLPSDPRGAVPGTRTRTANASRPAPVPVVDPYGILADVKLAFLAEALDPSRVQSILAAAIESADRARQMPLRAVRVTRHKPGRRCLIEYEFDGPGAAEPRTVVAKVRAKRLDETTHRLLQSLSASGFADDSRDGLSVPRPLGVIPKFQMTLQQKVPGISLARLVTGTDGSAIARRAADLIHKLHQSRVQVPRQHGIDEEIAVLNERLPRVADAEPSLRPQIDRLLAACDRAASDRNVRAAATTVVHRDFYPDQVIVDCARLYLLDLDLIAHGDPALDVGNFVAHLTELALRSTGDATAYADRERVMVERYAELAGDADGDLRYRIELYVGLTLARHVHISTLFADRRPFTPALLELAGRRLSTLNCRA